VTPGEITKPCLILTCSVLVHPRINPLALLDVNHAQLEDNWAIYSRASSLQDGVYTRTVPGLVPLPVHRTGHLRAAWQQAGWGAAPTPAHSSEGVQAGAGCVHPEVTLHQDRLRHTAQTGNLVLPLEPVYVIVSYTIYKSLQCFRPAMYAGG